MLLEESGLGKVLKLREVEGRLGEGEERGGAEVEERELN